MICLICKKQVRNYYDYCKCNHCNKIIHLSCFIEKNKCLKCNVNDQMIVSAMKEIVKFSSVYNVISPTLSI